MNFKDQTGKSIKDAWWKFHKANPKVYRLFCDEVKRAASKGKKKLSSKLIINYIRWNVYMETDTDDVYRINDAFTAYYARLFEYEHPEYGSIFEKRKLRS